MPLGKTCGTLKQREVREHKKPPVFGYDRTNGGGKERYERTGPWGGWRGTVRPRERGTKVTKNSNQNTAKKKPRETKKKNRTRREPEEASQFPAAWGGLFSSSRQRHKNSREKTDANPRKKEIDTGRFRQKKGGPPKSAMIPPQNLPKKRTWHSTCQPTPLKTKKENQTGRQNQQCKKVGAGRMERKKCTPSVKIIRKNHNPPSEARPTGPDGQNKELGKSKGTKGGKNTGLR